MSYIIQQHIDKLAYQLTGPSNNKPSKQPCFYKCDLTQNGFWRCKFFTDKEEAEKWQYKYSEEPLATRLISTSCYSDTLPKFIQQYLLYSKANFDVDVLKR